MRTDVSRKVQPRIGARRRARQCALQILYQLDGQAPHGGSIGLTEVLDQFWANFEEEAAQNRETVEFCEALLHGVFNHLHEIDDAIQKSTHHWRLERMARVDRNILRLSTFELLFLEDVPTQVALNEAVDLAKEFGTEESSAFVNGILDRLAQGLGK
jgi:N utilization substance protein B